MPSAAALEYQEQFDEILLDEYQDTNMVQEAIVALIARPGAGQPVHGRRREAEHLPVPAGRARTVPGEVQTLCGRRTPAAEREAAPGLRIDLARNFRSRREVVDGVNDVFRVIMRERAAEMDYDERAELKFGGRIRMPTPGWTGRTGSPLSACCSTGRKIEGRQKPLRTARRRRRLRRGKPLKKRRNWKPPSLKRAGSRRASAP